MQMQKKQNDNTDQVYQNPHDLERTRIIGYRAIGS